MTRIVNEYAKRQNPPFLKKTDGNFTGEDVREGLTAIVSVKVPEPQFEGQTKERLGNREVQGVTQSVTSEKFSEWLEVNPKPAKEILNKVLQSKGKRRGTESQEFGASRQCPGKLVIAG